jgi:hypothetical protein
MWMLTCADSEWVTEFWVLKLKLKAKSLGCDGISALCTGKWFAKESAYSCGPRRTYKNAQQCITKMCWNDLPVEHALRLRWHASAADQLHIGGPIPGRPINASAPRLRFVFATSDWLDLGHQVTLVIKAKNDG